MFLLSARAPRFLAYSAAAALLLSVSGLGGLPAAAQSSAATPIKHLVVIFQENVSFDHYFGTYPSATGQGGSAFTAKRGAPAVTGLTPSLLTSNPNGAHPQRLSPSNVNDVLTCDQDHNYTDEQTAFDNGAMDKFITSLGNGTSKTPEGGACAKSTVMNYSDGNTVTALWNYAQNFAMSDNSYGTVTGPSTPGALNLIAGQTHGASPEITDTVFMGTDISDADPTGDTASGTPTFSMTGKNVGDLLNAKGLTWGWFEGGFANPSQTHIGADGNPKADYIPHHEPFQYYPQTANPTHKPPSSVQMIGFTDQANHQYDITNFWQALASHNLPAVSYLKAPAYQDGHAGYSRPVFEQPFLVETINKLMKSPYWTHMAIIICYDYSDGWSDHVMPPNVNQSQTPFDVFTGPGQPGTNPPLGGYQGRFGYGPRLPLLVIL